MGTGPKVSISDGAVYKEAVANTQLIMQECAIFTKAPQTPDFGPEGKAGLRMNPLTPHLTNFRIEDPRASDRSETEMTRLVDVNRHQVSKMSVQSRVEVYQPA